MIYFTSQKQFTIAKILVAIMPFLMVFMLSSLGFAIYPFIENSLIVFVFLGLLLFEYCSSVQGKTSMKEKLKTDRAYKRKTLFYVLFLVGIFVCQQVFRALR